MTDKEGKEIPDFSVEYYGTITLLRPLTPACKAWIDENVASEGWQWFGGALAVEPRYLDTLVTDMLEEGFRPDDGT